MKEALRVLKNTAEKRTELCVRMCVSAEVRLRGYLHQRKSNLFEFKVMFQNTSFNMIRKIRNSRTLYGSL